MVERFEWRYTPKHGSWLDLAESELGVLSAQYLDRRIPDKQTLIDEIAAWEGVERWLTLIALLRPKQCYRMNLRRLSQPTSKSLVF